MQIMNKALLAVSCLLGGCTSLSTLPGNSRTSQEQALRGVSYALPMLQYQMTVTYSLKSCAAADRAPVFKIEAAATPQYVRGEEYRIDPTSLAGPLKTLDLTFTTYEHTGNLKSINASIVSHEAEFIAGAVQLGTRIASLVNPVTAAVTSAAAAGTDKERAQLFSAEHLSAVPRSRPVCTQEAITRLATRAAAKADVERLTGELNAATQQVEAIARRAALKLTGRVDRERLAQVQTLVITTTQALEAARSRFTTAQEALAFAESLEWPVDPFVLSAALPVNPRMTELVDTLIDQQEVTIPDPESLASALAAAVDRGEVRARRPDEDGLNPAAANLVSNEIAALRVAPRGYSCARGLSDLECLGGRLGLHAQLVFAGAAPSSCGPHAGCAPEMVVNARDAEPDPGIFIRPPGRAFLVICDELTPCHGTARDAVLETPVVLAPQAGQLQFVELSNGPLQSNSLSLSLREDGSVEQLQYADRTAVMAQAVASANSAAGTVADYVDQREEDRRTAIRLEREERAAQRTEAAAIRAERAAIAAEARTDSAAVRAEGAAVRADEIAQIQSSIDRLRRERELIDVQVNRQVVPQEMSDERTRIDAETALLRSRLALLQAQQALAEETD